MFTIYVIIYLLPEQNYFDWKLEPEFCNLQQSTPWNRKIVYPKVHMHWVKLKQIIFLKILSKSDLRWNKKSKSRSRMQNKMKQNIYQFVQPQILLNLHICDFPSIFCNRRKWQTYLFTFFDNIWCKSKQ